MRLDDVWLQTTLNTPNISGVWQIKKCSLVSLKAHQPRCCDGYVVACFRFMFFPDYDFFNIFYDLFLCSFGILLPMFQTKQNKIKKTKKQKQTCQWTLTTTTTYKKNTLKNIATNETAIY
jgi:hypothetical protein